MRENSRTELRTLQYQIVTGVLSDFERGVWHDAAEFLGEPYKFHVFATDEKIHGAGRPSEGGPQVRHLSEPDARQGASQPIGRMREPLKMPIGSDSVGQRTLGLPQWLPFPCRNELHEAVRAQQPDESIVVCPAPNPLVLSEYATMGTTE
jgi:hypothetical protein